MATNDTVKNSLIIPYPYDENVDLNDGRIDEGQVNMNVKIAVVLMLSIFSLVGVVGNAIAFYIFIRRRSTSTSIIFILALAGTDCFTCLVTIPYTIIFELLHYNLVYDGACKAYMFLITSTVPFSAYIMVGIALDRYFCICHPFLHFFTKPRAKLVILCMSIPALIFGIITALSHGTYVYEWSIQSNSSNSSEVRHFTVSMNDKSDVEKWLALSNLTNTSWQRNIVPYSMCVNNTFTFSEDFLKVYEKIHALNFLLAYVSVAVLYILIYRSICTRRIKRAKRKKSNLYPSAEKKKGANREETQMTAMNGGIFNSPKVLNNLTRKDAKSARKITLTARNSPTDFRKSDCQKTSRPAVSLVQIENGVNIVTKYADRSPCNVVNGKARNTGKSSKSPANSQPLLARDCLDIASCVYIGPQVIPEKNSFSTSRRKNPEESLVSSSPQQRSKNSGVYTGPQESQEGLSVYDAPQLCQVESSFCAGPQTSLEYNIVSTDLQCAGENGGVYTGPLQSIYNITQLRPEESSVYTGPQSSVVNTNVPTGPHQNHDEHCVYIGPQCSDANSGVYMGPHSTLKHSHPHFAVKVTKEEDKNEMVTDNCEIVTPTMDGNNIFDSVTKLSLNKFHKHGDIVDDTTPALYSAQQSSSEEKHLLPHTQDYPATSSVLQPSSSECITEETNLTAEAEQRKHIQAKPSEGNTDTNGVKRKRQGTIRDRHLMANIKTAFMLFIVTVVFILAFLPALLMANKLIQLNLLAFYGYFIYNVVNPFIYAFMNQTFRDDLKKLMNVCRRRDG